MYGMVSHDDVIQVIKNRDGLKAYIMRRKNQVLRMYQELVDGNKEDLMIWSTSARSKPAKEILVQESHDSTSPLDIMDKVQKEAEALQKSYLGELETIRKQEARMERIWMCFCMVSPESYMLLDEMYIQGEKWESLVNRMGVSRTTLKGYRRKALDEIIALYLSELTREQMLERREALAWKEANKVMVVQMEWDTFNIVLESLKVRRDVCNREGQKELSSQYANAIRHLKSQEHLCSIGRKAMKGRRITEY